MATALNAKHEREILELIDERDAFMEWADRLAYAIAPIDVIGEHSNLNDPWQNALDHLDGHILVERAELDRLRAVEAAARAEYDAYEAAITPDASAWTGADRRLAAARVALRAALTRKQP